MGAFKLQFWNINMTTSLNELLLKTLLSLDIAAEFNATHLELPDGLRLESALEETVVLKNALFQTATSITAFHETLFQDGVTEFQHSIGENQMDSCAEGFKNWARTDLVVLQDALRIKPEHCAILEIALPATEGHAKQTRQILLGPTTHTKKNQEAINDNEEHPFCPCCLFTNSINAFLPLLKSSDFLGIRFFVARHEKDSFDADCRINGEDFPAALPLLIQYAKTWPGEDFEFRKQYVVIRNKPG
jgi:hypothetical protein